MRLVFYVSIEDLRESPKDYYFDFGIEVLNVSEKYHKNEIELRPINAEGISYRLTVGDFLNEHANASELVEISGSWNRPFSYDYGARIFPIVREQNWEDGM